MAEENEKKAIGAPEAGPAEEPLIDETKVSSRLGWREIFRQAFDKARREHQVTNRRELGRDRSRSLFLLAAAAIAVLLVFLGVFSSSNTARKSTDARRAGAPDLGRRETPGQQTADQAGSVTPLLNAQTGQLEAAGNQGVTPEDVGRTARPTQPSIAAQPRPATAPVARNAGPYALGKIDFSDTATSQQTPAPSNSSAQSVSDDLRKPSLVFVRNVQSNSASGGARMTTTALEENPPMLDLPAGTRLVARLQSVVNSAIKTPVVAAVEYNYEKDGQIIVPAGAKALGTLQQADRSGYVAIRFDMMQMPDGTTEKIDAAAMSLTYGPLKGNVSGRRTGTRFLVRTFTGLGTAATYLVGAGGSNGFNGPLSESALLRDRIATNIGIAGDQELNGLAFNQNIVVTVPGNTRFYIVVEKSTASGGGQAQPAAIQQVSNTPLPTAEELRQLLQLRQELNEMVRQGGTQNTAPQVPQQ
jgi:Bacterial conjugation TrbI-like protein